MCVRIVCECDLAGVGVQRDRCDLGLGAVVRSRVAFSAISSCCFSLSSIFLGWKSFEGKIETKIDFRLGRGILQSTRKLISV